ncbi:MAG: putative chromosome segregation and condensation protein [Planctomycetota bacterium]
MGEIIREVSVDTQGSSMHTPRTKGPEELLLAERQLGLDNEPTHMGEPQEPLNRLPFPGTAEGETPPAPESVAQDVPAAVEGVEVAEFAAAEPAPELVAEVPAEPVAAPVDELPAAVDAPAEETAPGAEEGIDREAAMAAAAAAEEMAMVEEAGAEEEGLPAVPELKDPAAIARILFPLVLTQRDGLSLLRLAQACNTTQKLVNEALDLLQAELAQSGMLLELQRSGEGVKVLTAPATFPYLTRLRGVKKMEKLSTAALETLAVIAYRQPVMRSEIEAIRGVKAGPMLRTLLQHKLVRCTGRADVPGRPLQYGTTQQFLERFGLSSLQELPSVKEFKQLG